MLIHPDIDPVALRLGSFAIHWYGLTYLAAFGLFYGLGLRRLRHPQFQIHGWQASDVEDVLFWGAFGVILGGRLGYCLFYKPLYYFENPLEIFYVWQGGMSFHGGLLGVVAAMALLAWRRRWHFLDVADFIAPCVPVGLASGRLGNFINGELWGRVASPDLPWGMVFRWAGSQPRHPSQIYQFLLEGLLLFGMLWWFAKDKRPQGQVASAFVFGYGMLRFIAEYFREPDAHLGYLSAGLSMGQWLCVPMMVFGLGTMVWFGRNRVTMNNGKGVI